MKNKLISLDYCDLLKRFLNHLDLEPVYEEVSNKSSSSSLTNNTRWKLYFKIKFPDRPLKSNMFLNTSIGSTLHPTSDIHDKEVINDIVKLGKVFNKNKINWGFQALLILENNYKMISKGRGFGIYSALNHPFACFETYRFHNKYLNCVGWSSKENAAKHVLNQIIKNNMSGGRWKFVYFVSSELCKFIGRRRRASSVAIKFVNEFGNVDNLNVKDLDYRIESPGENLIDTFYSFEELDLKLTLAGE